MPVVGFTGTGGSGKSSLTDEMLIRFLNDFPEKRVAVLSVDPTRRKTGGALLGDRIRMNALANPKVYMRSMATRGSGMEVNRALNDVIGVAKAAGFDLIIAETAGIGQGDAAVVDLVDVSVYVMTSRFRRGQPAGKDRHAGFRRSGGHQQIRTPGGGRRASGRAQADAAQPGGLARPPGKDAGIRHHRQQVQRRRGDRILPGGFGRGEGKDRR